MVLRLSSWIKNYRSYGQCGRIPIKLCCFNDLQNISHSPSAWHLLAKACLF